MKHFVQHFTVYLSTEDTRSKYPARFQLVAMDGFTKRIFVLYRTKGINN